MSQKQQIPKDENIPRASSKYIDQIKEFLIDSSYRKFNDHLFLGKAGEYFIASQLIRRGFNASILPVDTGIDILAHKTVYPGMPLMQAEYETYQFQVKTTSRSIYSVSMDANKINELWYNTVNLIVVFWEEAIDPYIVIIPPSLLRMLTSGGFEDPKAPIRNHKGRVTLKIFSVDGHIYIRNKDNDISLMKNRYDRIEPIGTDTGMFPDYAIWSDGKGLVQIEQ